MINTKLLEYALLSISRRREKFIFITAIFTLLIFFSSSIFIITGALKQEASYTLETLPDITVQKIAGGRQQLIDSSVADEILEINGVVNANARVWGYYSFEYLNTNLTIIGVDPFDEQINKLLEDIVSGFDSDIFNDGSFMVIGEKFAKVIKQIYNSDTFSFRTPDGEYISLRSAGIFKSESQMLSTATVITSKENASKILGIPEDFSADISVKVGNPQEVVTISEKIKSKFPSFVTINKDIIEASYQNMFDFKGGIFLLFFLMSGFTFFIIVYDKTSGLSYEEKREIAIMKAIGWKISDVLKVKFYESFVVSSVSFLAGTGLSLFYVFALNAPGMKTLFVGYSYLKPDFELPFYIDFSSMVIVFLITIPIYTASIIIPSWRASVIDSEEIIR